jgi:TonB family protein
MAAGAQAQGSDQPSQRRGLRYYVQAPLDVTVLRSGVPDTVPGRSENLSSRGVAAVLAAELKPGESVGIEIRLPQAATPLRTRARVRYHDKLRCGLEFVGLSTEQQAEISRWTAEMKAGPETEASTKPPSAAGKGSEGGGSGSAGPPTGRRFGRGWIFLLGSIAILVAVLWWRWDRGWEDLESDLRTSKTVTQPQAHVPAVVMEKLVTHRVDPDYPAAARPDKLQGVIVLDVIVGRDGRVLEVHALNGPEILAQSATEALRWWRFEPYRVNGEPLVAETTVAVEFQP